MGKHAKRRVYRDGYRPWNWKGGRVVEPRGYVLLFVGKWHHLADSRGYAYEHRIVAEQMLGRRLIDGEEIHHDDEDKSNNDPGNLIVAGNRAEHFVHHRTSGIALRMPGEPNPPVRCECGCGASFLKYDRDGRPRRFLSGHNLVLFHG